MVSRTTREKGSKFDADPPQIGVKIARRLTLDEPAEGLAPVIVQQIGRTIRDIRQRGFTVRLVEQNFHFAVGLADRHYVLEHGRIVDMIERRDVKASMPKLHNYLGV